MIRRILLFMVTNVLVLLTLSLVAHALGIDGWLTQSGIQYSSLIVFCLVWGMGGALISLAISRIVAKTAMGVQTIDPNTDDTDEQHLVQTVYSLARAAHLPKMPEVGIYDSPEINAFATGPTRSRALVAVSTGLLQRLDRNQLEGVLSHEIAHIANGDMVTMTLLQGIINAFVMFLARILAFAISNVSRSDDEGEASSPVVNYILVMVLEMVFSILGVIVVNYFSRRREYRADSGGATIGGREKMISALEALQATIETPHIDNSAPSFANLKISGKSGGLLALFSSHPPLEDRIACLRSYSK